MNTQWHSSFGVAFGIVGSYSILNAERPPRSHQCDTHGFKIPHVRLQSWVQRIPRNCGRCETDHNGEVGQFHDALIDGVHREADIVERRL